MPSVVSPIGKLPQASVTAVADVSIVNDPELMRYDALELSLDLFNKLFPESIEEPNLTNNSNANNISSNKGDNDKFVLIKFLGAPDYFISFKIYKISDVSHKLSNLVKLINNSNLTRFSNDKLTLNSVVIQSIDIRDVPSLSSVFVSVPHEIYALLSNKSQSSIKSQFMNQFLQSSGNVVNDSDYIRLINGRIKLCEPVSQGLLDSNTTIILINQKEEDLEDGEPLDDIDLDYELEDEDFFDQVEDNLDLSTYLQSRLKFNKNSPATTSPKFHVRPLPEKLSVDSLPQQWVKEDSELYLFINSSDFIRLGFPVFNGDLIKLKYGTDNFIIVRIFTFTEPNLTFKQGTIYVSPILLINLGLIETSTVTFEAVHAQEGSISSVIPIADSVTISRVSSQITMDKTFQRTFFSSLKSTLSNQLKCVKQGDFFPVVIDSVMSKTIFDYENDDIENSNDNNEDGDALDVIPIGDPDAVAWFKIVEVKGKSDNGSDQFIIDPNKTLLVSSGVEFVKLPKNEFYQWYNYINLPPLFNFIEKPEFKYAKEFKKVLTTCMSSKIALKTTVLLNSLSRGIGKTALVRNVAVELGLNLIELDCFELLNPGQELKTIGLLSGKIDKLISNAPTNSSAFHMIYLKHIESLCPLADENDQNSSIFASLALKIIQTLNGYLSNYPNLAIVMSCNDYDKLNGDLKTIIKFTIDFSVPNETERLEIFKFLIHNERKNILGIHHEMDDINSFPFVIRKDINFKTLALQSAGLTPRDLISIIKKSKKLALIRLTKLSKEVGIPVSKLIRIGNGGLINWLPEDFNLAINEARNQFSDSIGAPRIPNVKWEDIGGLDLVKDEILDTIDMPLKHPELFNNGLKKRSGILFYGPPGTGKTLLAKAIATNFSLNFFSVKGPELLNMYIGESEANVRRVFQRARDAKPCVIFFDELDSVAPKRGNQGDSGGVMDRIVSQLLAELDGMSSEGGDGVFVVGATNRPDLLDEALLRPGRFDKMLYLGISDTNEKQTKILEALTRKFKLHDNVDLEKIAENCSFTFTGADFYALCSDSMLNAMTRVANEVDVKIKAYNDNLASQGKGEISSRWWFDNAATEADTTVLVQMEDFEKAQRELNPSVSAEELQHYLRVRENFEGGKDKAKQQPQELQPLLEQDLINGFAENGFTIDFSNPGAGAPNGTTNGH